MDNPSLDDLTSAVESQLGAAATLVDIIAAKEAFRGRIVWEGVVHVFDLEGHPTTTRAYVWSSPIEESDKRRIFAVLHVPPIESAHDAVRAAIVAELRATAKS